MTVLDMYTRACVPDTPTILGVKLRPFSLGHYFLFNRYDCGYVKSKEEDGGIIDLFLGVAICSRTYEDFLEFANDEKSFNEYMKVWGEEITRRIKEDKEFNFVHKMMDFQDYMRNAIVIPKFFYNKNDGKESGAHWSVSLLNALVSECGYTQSEALNAPLSKALFDYYKHLENNGVISLMGDDELQLLAEMEAQNGK